GDLGGMADPGVTVDLGGAGDHGVARDLGVAVDVGVVVDPGVAGDLGVVGDFHAGCSFRWARRWGGWVDTSPRREFRGGGCSATAPVSQGALDDLTVGEGPVLVEVVPLPVEPGGERRGADGGQLPE